MSHPQPPRPDISAQPRWWRIVMGLPVGFGGLLTCWLINALSLLYAARGLFILLAALMAIRFILRRYRWWPRLARGIDILLWVAAVPGWLALGIYAPMLAPWRCLLLIPILIAAFVLDQRRRTTLPASAAAIALLFVFGLYVWAPVLLVLPMIAAGLVLLARRRPDLLPHGARWMLWLLALLIVAVVFPFYIGQPWGEKAKLAGQVDVSPVYDATDENNQLFATIGRDVRFGRPDCFGRLLIGARGGPNGLVRLDNENITVAQTGPISESIVVNCSNKQLYVGDWETGTLQILDHNSLRIQTTIGHTRLTQVDQVRFNRLFQFVFMSAANSRNIFSYDLFSKKKEMVNLGRFITDFAYLPQEGLFVAATYGGRLLIYRQDISRLLQSLWLPDFHLRLAPDPSGKTLYILGQYSGLLMEFSLAERRVVRRRWLGPGVRSCAFDKRDDLLYVGNYFSGTVTTLTRSDLKTVGSHRVGPRLHSLHYDHSLRRLLAANALGLVQIKLAE